MYFRLPGKTPDRTRARCDALADRYARHPLWRDVLALVLRGVDGNDREGTARALWGFVRRRITFQPEVGEQLQTPATTIRRRMGDCDDQHILLSALLRGVGFETRGVLLRRTDDGRYFSDTGSGSRPPGRAFHIWTQVRLAGRWVDAETVHPQIRFGVSPVAAIRGGLTIQ